MLVSGLSLPVLRYVWSSSRSREPLLRPWQFRPRKPTMLSLGAIHRGMCTGRRDIYALSGANSYMVKPVNFARLRHALELLMRYWFGAVTLPQRRSP